MDEKTARRDLIRICHLMYERSYVVSSDGNVSVQLAEYGTPSTQELTDAMRPLVKHHNALLMANHGAVAYGTDLWQAFDRLETLEHTAKIAILSRALGGSRNLSPDAVEKLTNVR